MTPDGDNSTQHGLQRPVTSVMSADLITAAPSTSIREVARLMHERRISSMPVVEPMSADTDAGQRLVGLVTEADITGRVVAEGLPVEQAVSSIMTKTLFTVGAGGTVFDVLNVITRHRVAHVPVVEAERLVGIVTQTDLVKLQTTSPLYMMDDIARADSSAAIAAVVATLPSLLAGLVDGGASAREIGHMISSVADAATRRLIELAERSLGDAPVPWLWLACGSQGRREQTGVSDQDHCLILDDRFDPAQHDAWFEALAQQVSDGLAEAGYAYCPGDMMATNRRWRQPVSVWQDYFNRWINHPEPTARLLSSVMFDLRPIQGDENLYLPLQQAALEQAHDNSIFIAHMCGNALEHRPPIGLFNRLLTERRGPHRGTVDLKHHGSAPVVELARIQGFTTRNTEVSTLERLLRFEGGAISRFGCEELHAAYEYITQLRLQHQADQVRAGQAPDNFLDPRTLGPRQLRRLRDSFKAIKTVQSNMASRFATLGR